MRLNNLCIHFGFIFLKIKEGSQSASDDPAGLGENERAASVEPSPNRSGLCEDNSKNVNYLLFM